MTIQKARFYTVARSKKESRICSGSCLGQELKPKNQKNHLSKENVWFQIQKMVFWFSLVFFCFFWIFHCFFWFFQLPDLKKPKKLKEKDGFCSKIIQKTKKNQGKRWFLLEHGSTHDSKTKKTYIGKRWFS